MRRKLGLLLSALIILLATCLAGGLVLFILTRIPVYPNSSFESSTGPSFEIRPLSKCPPCLTGAAAAYTTTTFRSGDSPAQIETWLREHAWHPVDAGLYSVTPGDGASNWFGMGITVRVLDDGHLQVRYSLHGGW